MANFRNKVVIDRVGSRFRVVYYNRDGVVLASRREDDAVAARHRAKVIANMFFAKVVDRISVGA